LGAACLGGIVKAQFEPDVTPQQMIDRLKGLSDG